MVVNSTKSIKLESPSKINLGLWVKEKRADGYHEIETIFLENKSLLDEIEINIEDSKQIEVSSFFTDETLNNQIPNEANLTTKACELFLKEAGRNLKCKIKINKRIPHSAGLGGGSSNAGSVLKGLNSLLDNLLSKNDLLLLAEKLGSDVPYFMYGGTCFGKSKGENLEPLENNLNLEIKVIKPEISISTKWAYDQIDSREFIADHKMEISNLISSMKSANYDLFFKSVFNDFEMVAFSYYPEFIKIRKKLLEEGYASAGLCGSGSAIFGIKKTK